jgi:hypothetical protein
MELLQETHNITVIRRSRLKMLLQDFFQEQAALGLPPKGLEQAFALKLQISPSLLSQIKKSRPIGDKLARQIEAACSKASQWLDSGEQLPCLPSDAEEAFIELARAAWRKSNAHGKAELRRMMLAKA